MWYSNTLNRFDVKNVPQFMRCNVSWKNAAEIALFKKCGFALACIEDGQYFTAKPLQGYACNA